MTVVEPTRPRWDLVKGSSTRGAIIAALAAITALAAVLRFVRLGHQGFWFDEANTAFLVHFSPGKMLGRLPAQESTPPLYYCLAWVWARVFGYGEAGLRSLSALAGVLTVPVAYAAAARLITRRVGLIAATLVACSPFLIWYSQEARSYELLVFLTTCSLCGFAFVWDEPRTGWLALWVSACALALATHYYAFLAAAPQATLLLIRHRDRPRVLLAVGLVVACGVALIPLAISQQGSGNSNWIAGIPLGLRLQEIPPQFLIGTGAPAAGWLKLGGALAVVLSLGLLVRRADDDERRGAVIALGLVTAGMALILVLVAAGVDDLISRNVIVLWVPALVALAAGFGARRAGPLGPAGAALLCAVGVAAAVGVAFDRSLQRPDWRGVAKALAPAGHRTEVVLIRDYGTRLPLALYLPKLSYLSHRGARVQELDVVAVSSHPGRNCWWGADCNLARTELPLSAPVPGFRPSGAVREAGQFRIERFRAARPTLITPRNVALGLARRYRKDQLYLLPGS